MVEATIGQYGKRLCVHCGHHAMVEARVGQCGKRACEPAQVDMNKINVQRLLTLYRC